MWEVLSTLTKMIAPVLCFTAEEIWQEMRKMDSSLEESVHMTAWPKPDAQGLDESVSVRWEKVMEVRGAISRALEVARTGGIIGHALDASVWMVPGENYANLQKFVSDDLWETITIVSGFAVVEKLPEDAAVKHNDDTTGILVGVSKNPHEKCPRCWKHRAEVGKQPVCARCTDALASQG